jgi:NTP pyrophosphatase (non-canonical NTP hydrolase)
MDLNQYVKDAIRTESQVETINADYDCLVAIMKTFVAAGNMLDDFKKNIFYGKPIDQYKWDAFHEMVIDESANINKSVDSIISNKAPVNVDPRLLHALIGIATESTELIEAILTSFAYNEPIDNVNVREEMFDLLWYILIGHDAMDYDVESTLNMGFEKLRKRYPEKFTVENAINRDLAAEREILESHSPS